MNVRLNPSDISHEEAVHVSSRFIRHASEVGPPWVRRGTGTG